MRGRELSSWSAAAAMLLAGTWMLHGATLAADLGRLPGDMGDTRFNLLVLEHGWRFLHGQGHGSFWSPTWLFWPHANTLAYSHNLVGDWPLYAPFRALGLDPVHAFGAFLVLCTLGNFVATLALGRALGLSVLGSAAAASLFAFGMPRAAQLGHPQLLPQLWTPLCFFCATLGWRKWQAGRRNAACVLCAAGLACAALQLAASIYLGVLLLIAGASAAPGAAARLGRDRLRAFLGRTWPGWLAGSALGAVLLAPLAEPYARAHDELGGRPLGAIAGMLPRPTSYLLPSPGAVLYQPLTRLAGNLPMAWEHTMFAGLAPLAALVFLALALWRRRPLPVSGGAAAAVLGLWGFTFVATLRVGSWHGVPLDLWCLLNAVPGLDSLRAVTRVGLVQLLAGGLAVGIGVTALRARPRLALALALLPIVENWSRCPAGVTAAEVGARALHVERAIGPRCRAFFWQGDDPAAPPYAVQLDAMWASFDLGIPTLNGYSGNEPPGWPLGDPRAVTPEMARAWLERAGVPADGFCFVP